MNVLTSCPICKNDNDFNIIKYDKNPSEDKWSYNCFSDKELAECKDCKFIFTRHEFQDEELNIFYSNLYRQKKLNHFLPHVRYEFIPRNFSHVNFIKNNFNLKDNMDILEIGPNQHGMIASFNFYCNSNYYYFEQHDFPIIKRYGGERIGTFFNKKNIEMSDKKKFDLIVLGHSLEHFDPSTLRENLTLFFDILNNNGAISIEVPLGYKLEKMPPHTLFFNIDNLTNLLESMNLKLVSTQVIDSPTCNTNLSDQSQNIKKEKVNDTKVNIKQLVLNKIMLFPYLRNIVINLIAYKHLKMLTPLYDGRPYIRVLAQKI